jgi:hypothetical protein
VLRHLPDNASLRNLSLTEHSAPPLLDGRPPWPREYCSFPRGLHRRSQSLATAFWRASSRICGRPSCDSSTPCRQPPAPAESKPPDTRQFPPPPFLVSRQEGIEISRPRYQTHDQRFLGVFTVDSGLPFATIVSLPQSAPKLKSSCEDLGLVLNLMQRTFKETLLCGLNRIF